jgi:hypothetical protein
MEQSRRLSVVNCCKAPVPAPVRRNGHWVAGLHLLIHELFQRLADMVSALEHHKYTCAGRCKIE